MPTADVAVCGGHAGGGITGEGFTVGRGLCPGSEVLGLAFQGRKRLQRRPGQGLPAVVPAFVEAGGEVGQLVDAGHPGGGGDRQITAALRAVSPLWEPRAFFRVTTGPRIASPRRCCPGSPAGSRGGRSPSISRSRVGERLLRGLGQAGGLRLLLPGLVDHRAARRPRPASLLQPGRGHGFLLRGGRGGLLPGGRELVVSTVQVPDPVQPRLRPVRQLGGVRVPGPKRSTCGYEPSGRD